MHTRAYAQCNAMRYNAMQCAPPIDNLLVRETPQGHGQQVIELLQQHMVISPSPSPAPASTVATLAAAAVAATVVVVVVVVAVVDVAHDCEHAATTVVVVGAVVVVVVVVVRLHGEPLGQAGGAVEAPLLELGDNLGLGQPPASAGTCAAAAAAACAAARARNDERELSAGDLLDEALLVAQAAELHAAVVVEHVRRRWRCGVAVSQQSPFYSMCE